MVVMLLGLSVAIAMSRVFFMGGYECPNNIIVIAVLTE